MSLANLLDEAGLTGRGGAAFATGIKVRAAHESGATLIVNACDGEVGAAKDGWVVAHHLPALIEGARLVTGGRPVRVAAKRGSRTLELLTRAGVDVLAIPNRYVSSEESALISLAQGGLARPLTKTIPFVRGQGRDGNDRPIPATVVLNAETVWRVAQIADRGPGWFRSQGTATEPGPRLVAIGGAVARPAVLEAAAGMPIRALLDHVGVATDAEYVGVGGLGGILLPRDTAAELLWSSTDLARFGGSVGPGVVTVHDPSKCIVDTVDHLLTYAAGESAGQCGPCMFGLPAIATDWHALATGIEASTADSRLERRLAELPGRGACRFPDGIARFASSARTVLADHLTAHALGHCPTHPKERHVA